MNQQSQEEREKGSERKGLVGRSRLVRKNIDKRQYTVSLINEALRAGLISEEEADSCRMEIMEILKRTILKYTGGDSTSVPAETAEKLLLSVLFCLDTACCQEAQSEMPGDEEDPELALAFLRRVGVATAFRQGQERVQDGLAICRQQHVRLLAERLETGLIAYNDTIDHALPDFFSKYDAAFCAHDTMAGIDYPLAHDRQDLMGVWYVLQYLHTLELENAFCKYFDSRDIESLLENYGRVYRIDYRDCLINIFEIILSQAVLAVLAGRPPGSLALSRTDLMKMQDDLARRSRDTIIVAAGQARRKLLAGLGISDPELRAYALGFECDLGVRLFRALEQEQLDQLAIVPLPAGKDGQTVLQPGSKMEDEAFRTLVDKIIECPEPGAKAAMIMDAVHSVHDFIDILDADCLYDDDYWELFALLGHLEMSLLAGAAFGDDWRDSRLPWPEMMAERRANASGWQQILITYLIASRFEPDWDAFDSGYAARVFIINLS